MVQNHTAELNQIHSELLVTDGTTEFTSVTGDTSTVDVNGDIFLLSGKNANVTLWNDLAVGNTPANPNSVTTLSFSGASSITLHAGTGHDFVTADGGNNKFISAAMGTLDVTGGKGADAYYMGVDSEGLTINDFSLAKGDTLTVTSLWASPAEMTVDQPDGHGGTEFGFRNGLHHSVYLDVNGTVSAHAIHFATVS